MTSTRWTAGLIALGLSLAACGAPATSDQSEAASAPATDSTAAAPATDPAPDAATETDTATETGTDTADEAPAAVPAALQFSAPLVGGGELNAAELAGKPTAFWFWAPT